MHLTALINPQAGSVVDDAEGELCALLEEIGVRGEVVSAQGEDLGGALRSCASAGCDVLAVWGGDGTLAWALEAVGSGGPAILPLPGGTMNLLHRKVHGIGEGEPIDWKACLRGALRAGRTKSISAGQVNEDRKFYVGAMFGELAGLSRAREAIREGRPMAAMEQANKTGAFDLATSLAFHEIRGEDIGTQGAATALAAFVPENEAGGLEIGWIDPDNLAELAGVGLEIAIGDWRAASGVEYHRWDGLRIFHARDEEIEATLDGEPVKLPSGSRLSFVPEAARVLAAPAS